MQAPAIVAGMKRKLRSTSPLVALAACRVELTRQAPTELRLVPAGRFRARDGRPHEVPEGWFIDAGSAARIIERVANRHDKAVIDYEHQTLNAEKNGQPAPAAGWFDFDALEWREDGLYAVGVEWTTTAQDLIEAGEYRYLSPVLLYHPRTGEVLDITMAALTNYPAIDGLDGLAAQAAARFSINHSEDSTVDREQLITLLGLALDATDEAITAALTAGKEASAQLAALRGELGIGGEDEPVAAVAALKTKAAAAVDASQFVPKAVFAEVQGQLAELKANSEGAQIDALIKEGMDDGRIAGQATAEWLKSQGLAALKAHLADAPSIAALTTMQTQGQAPKGDIGADGELSAAELAVCKAMGISADDYAKSRVGA